MKLDTWIPIYEGICKDFGFATALDLQCAKFLGLSLGDRSDSALDLVRQRVSPTVLVCGGADSLADELSSMEITWPVVAADGATTVLLEAGILPDVIVTDLDGIVEDQIESNNRGTPVMIHAHGDNRKAVERYLNSFKGAIVGTCQCIPPEHVFNFGGFTDGDRAACIFSELGAKKVLLAGFDFSNPSRKPGKNLAVKRRKLVWARKILDELGREGIDIIPVMEYRGD